MRSKSCLAAQVLLTAVSYPLMGADSQWIRLKSPNFEIYSSASQRNARDTIREFEQVRDFFLQTSRTHPSQSTPVRLVAFGSVKEYEPYRLNEFATAYYHATPDRDYIVMSRSGVDIFPTAVHEYVHLLVQHAGLKFPPWLNEGLAELYSTLKPQGDKILVGDLIPGRFQALLRDKWVPLATILTADHNSPYYNEKDKAGSLYNEGWALTHMLCFRQEYRPKFDQLMRSISNGEGSIQALENIYGKPLAKIENDVQAYLRGTFFQGALFAAKLEKSTDEIPTEMLTQFDTGLMFADLLYRPGKESAVEAALQQLQQKDPNRYETYRGLGYVAWGANRRDQAVELFGHAYEHGDRDGKFLWDYGRLLPQDRGADAIKVFSDLLSQDTERTEVRLELASRQLQARQAKDALETLRPVREVTPEAAPRLFRVTVYAYLQIGDQKSAQAAAKHFQDIAKTDEDRAAAELLVRTAAGRGSAPPPMTTDGSRASATSGDSRPMLQRRLSPSMTEGTTVTPPSRRPSVSGRFVELNCGGKQARMVIETDSGRMTFLIADPEKVAITSGSSGPVDMQCGPQGRPVHVEVGYDPPPAGQPGLDGVVKTLAF